MIAKSLPGSVLLNSAVEFSGPRHTSEAMSIATVEER